MKTRHYLVILLLAAGSLLAACGQKGALYMPDQAVPQEQKEEKQ